MTRERRRTSDKAGLPPGTPVHVGRATDEPVRLQVVDYTEEDVEEREVGSPAEAAAFRGTPTVTWINVTGVHDVDLLSELGREFGLHPLVQEDIANTTHRPKFEEFDGYLFVVVKVLTPAREDGTIGIEQLSFILGPDYVVSFQERASGLLGPLRDRIRQGKGRIRRMGAGYLLSSLLDVVVDGYFAVCEDVSDRMEALHDDLLHEPGPSTLQQVHVLKRQGVQMRRAVWPLREAIGALDRSDSALLDSGMAAYLRSVYEHTVQVIDTVETFRDAVGGMADLYLSAVSNRMNEVMKVLTIIATIFIPLSFVAGVYGMNFESMPELGWRWGYPAALAFMLCAGGGMLAYFRRRGWW